MAKSSWVTNDLEGKMKYAATQRATKRGGKFHRSGSEGDMWLVDAFVQHGQHVTAGPLRGKVAEKLFLSVPNAKSAMAASRKFSSKPHMAGSPGDLDTAMTFLDVLQRELGIAAPKELIYPAGSVESRNATLSIPTSREPRAWIDVYYPILNTPLQRSLEILGEDGNSVWQANLEEEVDEADPDAFEHGDVVPAFHGLSANGEVEGKLVYAHYGRKQDYDALVDAGVDLNGTIVITRYGGPFRGLKVKAAQELGAAGVLIYSDLRDDGTVTKENGYAAYPHGPARSETSVQRGSVQYLSTYPGDPTTPGYPSYPNCTRERGTSYPDIPSLPISWATAKVLLKEIENVSGKNRTVRLVNHGQYQVTPIWNVMGLIPGHIKDEVLVVGNHRDAWVMGANDPSSGTAALHEVIRGLGVLLKSGWKPLRSILIASWDAEEFGLIGSTEWGEDFPGFIDEHVAAYINLDSASTGSRFGISASPSLAHLVRDTAREIPHPTKEGESLWDARLDKGPLVGNHIDPEFLAMHEDEEQSIQDDSLGVRPLGSGSDYTVFLQHIGVASSQAAFKSTLSDPVNPYHSVYDTQRFQELYADPGFVKHIAVAKQLGLQLVRMADSTVLPLNTTHYSYELETYLQKVETAAIAHAIDIDLSSLQKAIRRLQLNSAKLDDEKDNAGHELERLIRQWQKRHLRCKKKVFCKIADFFRLGVCTSSCVFPSRKFIRAVERVRAVNQKLVAYERGFISEDGIKDREWYKHLAVAPGKWLGYGSTTFPALTESLTIDQNATLAQYETDRLTSLIHKLAKELAV